MTSVSHARCASADPSIGIEPVCEILTLGHHAKENKDAFFGRDREFFLTVSM